LGAVPFCRGGGADPAAGAGKLDALICGGDKAAVASALADPRLAPLLALRIGPFLPVPDPRLRVLQATPEQFLVVTLHVHP